jgi:hypothetical protein
MVCCALLQRSMLLGLLPLVMCSLSWSPSELYFDPLAPSACPSSTVQLANFHHGICLATDPDAVIKGCDAGDSECIGQKLFALKKCDASDRSQAWHVNFSDVDGTLEAKLVTPSPIVISTNASSWLPAEGFLAKLGEINFMDASTAMASADYGPGGMDSMTIPMAKEWCEAHNEYYTKHLELPKEGCLGFTFQALNRFNQAVMEMRDPNLGGRQRQMLQHGINMRARKGPLNATTAEDRLHHTKHPLKMYFKTGAAMGKVFPYERVISQTKPVKDVDGAWHSYALVTPRRTKQIPGTPRFVLGKNVEELNNRLWQFAPPQGWEKCVKTGGCALTLQERKGMLSPLPRATSLATSLAAAAEMEALPAPSKHVLTFKNISAIFTNMYRLTMRIRVNYSEAAEAAARLEEEGIHGKGDDDEEDEDDWFTENYGDSGNSSNGSNSSKKGAGSNSSNSSNSSAGHFSDWAWKWLDEEEQPAFVLAGGEFEKPLAHLANPKWDPDERLPYQHWLFRCMDSAATAGGEGATEDDAEGKTAKEGGQKAEKKDPALEWAQRMKAHTKRLRGLVKQYGKPVLDDLAPWELLAIDSEQANWAGMLLGLLVD